MAITAFVVETFNGDGAKGWAEGGALAMQLRRSNSDRLIKLPVETVGPMIFFVGFAQPTDSEAPG